MELKDRHGEIKKESKS